MVMDMETIVKTKHQRPADGKILLVRNISFLGGEGIFPQAPLDLINQKMYKLSEFLFQDF